MTFHVLNKTCRFATSISRSQLFLKL
uniref:Uncharacterized protein n=1 Tax=Anguilla anguilla TaxID=7936 RepID=A0A0E9TRI2_ANGAN